MNKIIVEVSTGELLDKISILEIKKEKIKDPNKLYHLCGFQKYLELPHWLELYHLMNRV